MLAGALESVDLTVYDHLFEMRGPRPVMSPIVIAGIDRESIQTLGSWPFPRAVHARAIDALARAKPIVVGMDILFSEPSARGAADDDALGTAIARAGNIVLATASFVDVQPIYVRRGYLLPLPSIRHGAVAIGSITDYEVGRRARMRDSSLPDVYGGPGPFTLPVQVARLAAGALSPEPRLEDRDFLINFRGPPGTFRRISYHNLVRGTVPPAELEGAIVLIGSVDRAVPDSFRTPFARGGTMPGVELHATAVETLLRGDAIREVPIFVSAIATVVAGLIVGAFVAWLPGRAVEGTAGVLALMVTATYVAFAYGDVWFRATGPGLALAVGFVLSIVAWGLPPSPSA